MKRLKRILSVFVIIAGGAAVAPERAAAASELCGECFADFGSCIAVNPCPENSTRICISGEYSGGCCLDTEVYQYCDRIG